MLIIFYFNWLGNSSFSYITKYSEVHTNSLLIYISIY